MIGTDVPRMRSAQSVTRGETEVDRLLAEHGLPGGDRSLDQVGMGRGRSGDQHCVDVGAREDGFGRIEETSIEICGHVLGRRSMHVEHTPELCPRMRRNVGRVHAPDPAAAEHGNSNHLIPPLKVSQRLLQLS